jgi:hypothetical protein
MALVGTSIFAAVDRTYAPTEGQTGTHRDTRAKNDVNVIRTPLSNRGPLAEAGHPSSPETHGPVETKRELSAVPTPLSAAPATATATAIDRSRLESSGTLHLVVQASTDAPNHPVPPSSVALASREPAFQKQTTLDAPASLNGTSESGPSDASYGASAICQLTELRSILTDVSARFGGQTVVAAHQFKTVNHIAGSTREKMHHDCKAIDFQPDPTRIDEIKAYLRTRPEISGIESYRDGVIHIDAAGALVAGGGHNDWRDGRRHLERGELLSRFRSLREPRRFVASPFCPTLRAPWPSLSFSALFGQRRT